MDPKIQIRILIKIPFTDPDTGPGRVMRIQIRIFIKIY
jgi:hypothetical protein